MFLVTEQWAGDYVLLISQMGTHAIDFYCWGTLKEKLCTVVIILSLKESFQNIVFSFNKITLTCSEQHACLLAKGYHLHYVRFCEY